MNSLLVILFGMTCLLGVANPRSVVNMIVWIHGVEQLLQAEVLFLYSGVWGGQLGNYLIGISSFRSALFGALQRQQPFVGLMRTTITEIAQLLVWPGVSTLSSRDQVGWPDMAVAKWPCNFLSGLVTTFPMTNTADVTLNINFQPLSSSEIESCFYLSWTEATWAT
jgi:hypothetical protein